MYYGFPAFGIPIFGLPSFAAPETPSQGSSGQLETVINFEYYIFGQFDAISPELYKYVSDKYGGVYQTVLGCKSAFSGAANLVASMENSPQAKIDLLKQLRNSERGFDQTKFTSNLYSAVSTINKHVVDRNGMSDINDWLSYYNVKVVREWASLCEQTGTIIDESNIES
jgi:hypothetical protein